MSNGIMNQSGIPSPTLAMRTRAKVFSTEDGQDENPVACHFEQPLYSPYSTTLDLRVPPSDYASYLRPPDVTGFGRCLTHTSAGCRASDFAFKPCWSGRAHFKFQANEGWTPICRMPSA
jgi:hypothetical protein